MALAEQSPCPSCTATGTLSVDQVFDAAPIGDYSLAGVMMKTTGRFRPVLRCSACGLDHLGEYDTDGRHVLFPPIPVAPARA